MGKADGTEVFMRFLCLVVELRANQNEVRLSGSGACNSSIGSLLDPRYCTRHACALEIQDKMR